MSDGVTLPAAAGKAATREVTYSGETMQVQTVGLATFAGSDDAKTATDVTTSNPLPIGGIVAHDGVDSGNPIKTGGYASGTQPTGVVAGDRVNQWLGLQGATPVALGFGMATAADGVSNDNQLNLGVPSGSVGGLLPVVLYISNGTTFDRVGGTTTNGIAVEVTKQPKASTATTSAVADTASSVQLLASSGARRGAAFHNNSTQTAYLKFGTTATVSDYTVPLVPGAFYELNPINLYTGRIDAIWAANASGSMQITEW